MELIWAYIELLLISYGPAGSLYGAHRAINGTYKSLLSLTGLAVEDNRLRSH
jgi:hypothetical protein